MNITSLTYIIFLFISVVLYYSLSEQLKIYWLLLCSAAFYMYAMPGGLLLTMVYVWIIYLLGLAMKKAASRKVAMIVGILVSVAFLFIYKYLNFTLELFTGNKKTFSLIAPIGISYITFQCIAYLVDIYKKKSPVVKNPVWFFLYALFFAKIAAGPIEPPKKFFENVKLKKTFSYNRAVSALLLIVSGFVKKMVIADLLAPGVAAVFDAGQINGSLSAILAAVMYSIEILFDFSGYTDIARGSALMFGYNLTENFKAPYMATGIIDFWKRWHISLTDWLRNYIYIPLGGSRKGRLRKYTNVFVTFIVSGLWHGAAFTFIFWGLLHGIFQIMEMLLKPVLEAIKRSIKSDKAYIYLSRIITFIMVTFAWIFFRAESMGAALNVIKGMFSGGFSVSTALSACSLTPAIIALMVVGAILTIFIRRYLDKQQNISPLQAAIMCTAGIWLVFISLLFVPVSAGNTFIYFNF